MIKLLRVPFAMAICGLLATVIVHVLTFRGTPGIASLRVTLIFTAGVVLLSVPTWLAWSRSDKDTLAEIVGLRSWMALITIPAFAYIVFNFWYTGGVLLHGGLPEVRSGYVLVNRNKVVKVLDENEFKWAQINEARRDTSFWMAAYIFAALLLFHGMKPTKASVLPENRAEHDQHIDRDSSGSLGEHNRPR